MHNRATSESSTESTHSPFDISSSESDIERLISAPQFDTTELFDLASPRLMPIPQLPEIGDDSPGTIPLIRSAIVGDEPNPESKTTMQKDALFYWEDVVLQVEGTLFRFPKGGLTGAYFDTLFSQIASNPATLKQGTSADNPIVLDGVSKDHFQDFLRLICPLRGIQPPSTDNQWLGVLHLATEWQFADIRETALAHLEHLFKSASPPSEVMATKHDPIRALALCLKYDITQHTAHQYELIISSTTPLKRKGMLAEGLDADTVELITEMREEWLCRELFGYSTIPSLHNTVKDLFPKYTPAQLIVEQQLSKDLNMLCMSDDEERLSRGEESGQLAAAVIVLERNMGPQVVGETLREQEDPVLMAFKRMQSEMIETERKRQEKEQLEQMEEERERQRQLRASRFGIIVTDPKKDLGFVARGSRRKRR